MKLFNRLFHAGSLAALCAALAVAGWAQQAPPPPPGADQSYPAQGDQNYPNQAPDQAYPDQNAPDNAGPDQAGPPPNYNGPNGPNGPNGTGDDQGPPARVARLQYLSGSVSVQPHGTDDWVQGSVNRPLTNADNIWADKDSRAELNLGTGILRIGAESSLTLTNVTDNSAQVQLHQGALNVHIRHLYNGEVYEVDTPNLAFTISKPGDYRLDVDPNADYTLVTVWSGEGQATGQGQPVTVHSGEQARFSNGTSLAHDIHAAPQPDQFDDWCRVRDQHADTSASAKYVSPDMIGSEDLDEYGTWKETPDYGNVWEPSGVGPDWAPYTDGQWDWISPWGWTWVDNAPWGFAPFHYGRWVYWGGGWGWAPGPYLGPWYRGWYAPGLVAWFGGPHWGVGFGFGIGGGFGWCPLGWGEPFFPWYHAGWGYFRGVNIYNTRIVNINHYHGTFNNFVARGSVNGVHYANISHRGGFTAVSANTLQHGLPVHSNMVHVSASAARGAPALGRPGVTPTRSAMLGPKAGMAAAHPSAGVTSRPTVSRMRPPAGSRGATTEARGNVNAGARTSTPGNVAKPSAGSSASRNVPRPPSAENESRRPTGETANRPATNSARSVPRPPTASNESSRAGSAGNLGRPSEAARPSGPSSSSIRNVPRPTGPVRPAPGSYSSGSAGSRSNEGYSSRSYGSSEAGRSYGGNGSYSSRSYGGSSAARSAPYGGYSGGYSHGSSSYGGSRSFGGSSGGGHYSAPSHSSGGSHSFGGGSHGGGGGSHGGGGGGHHGR